MNSGGDDYDNASGYNSQDQNYGFNAYGGGGPASNASGHQDSQIDVIETPFSRSRTQRRTAGGPAAKQSNNQLQRPPTGNINNMNTDLGGFGGGQMNFDRVQTSPVGNMGGQN